MAETGNRTENGGADKRRAARGGTRLLVFVMLIGALAFAFAYSIANQSAAATRANDTKAFQRLAIAAQGLQIWPGIAQQMAARSLRWKGADDSQKAAIDLPHITSVEHPQFGQIRLVYTKCAVTPAATAPEDDTGSTTVKITPAGLLIKGPTVTQDSDGADGLSNDARRARSQTRLDGGQDAAICFVIGPIAFDKALQLPADFLSLLVIDKESESRQANPPAPSKSDAGKAQDPPSAITRPGLVIAQVGPEKLPVRSLEELPDLDKGLQRKAQAIVELAAQQATGSAASVAAARALLDQGQADTLAPLETVIAGKAYRLYPYPVSLVGKEGQPPSKLLLVGVTDVSNPALAPDMSGARLLTFGLLLAALLALTPFMRLAFLGPVDAVKPMELATLALGLMLIGAISAALLVLGWDSVRMRAVEDAALKAQAETLATAMSDEMLGKAATRIGYKQHLQRILDGNHGDEVEHPVVQQVALAEPRQPQSIELPAPDSVFFMNDAGRQPNVPTLGVAEHDRISGLFALGDRPYFLRARAGDLVPGTADIATAYASSLGLGAAKPAGLVVDHVLSRGDGVAKVVMAFPLHQDGKAGGAHGVAVVGMAMVMDSMLAPALTPGVGYAVVDLSSPEWRSVFHSDPQRAHAELFALSLGAEAHDAFRLRAELRPRPDCTRGSAVEALPFWGTYIGRTHRLAAVRVPCTDWAVVTFQALADSEVVASQPAEIAIFAWAGFAALFGSVALVVLWGLNRFGVPVMQSLWPDPALTSEYGIAGLAGLAIALIFGSYGLAVPASAKALVPLSAVVGVALVVFVFWRGRAVRHDRAALDRKTEFGFATYLVAVVTLVSVVPVMLLASDSRAYAAAVHQEQTRIARIEAPKAKENQKVRIWNTMFPGDPRPLQPYTRQSACGGAGLFTTELLKLVESDLAPANCRQDTRNAASASATPAVSAGADRVESDGPRVSARLDFRKWLELVMVAVAALLLPALAIASMCRNLFGFGVPLQAVDYPRLTLFQPDLAFIRATDVTGADDWETAYPGSIDTRRAAPAGPDAAAAAPGLRPVLRLHVSQADLDGEGLNALQAELAKLCASIMPPAAAPSDAGADTLPGALPDRPRLLLVVPAAMQSPRETLRQLTGLAWEQEGRPPYDDARAPWLAMLVSADDRLRQQLTGYAAQSFDLFEGRAFSAIRQRLDAASNATRPVPLIIVHNLELLLRSDVARKEALRLLEQMVVHQQDERAAGRGYRILLLADISPLDRFLQTSEFREEQEDAGRIDSTADASESIRWTRLLENFTTYTRRIRARVGGTEMQALAAQDRLPGNLGFLLRELNHIPDRVVKALLPDPDDDLTVKDILGWGRFLENSRKASISDFLSSQLIEHYHYLWSISSRAEQILIHRFAAGQLPNIRTAFALRSLVRRGIVVFDPAPRLMSQSFAEFIQHVERPELLGIWERSAPKGLWSRLHGNVTVVLPLLLLLGVIIVLRGAVGIEAAVPLVLAAGPALLNALFGSQRTA